jgi:hypothetical protein
MNEHATITRVAVDAGSLVTKVVSGRSEPPDEELALDTELHAAVTGRGREGAALDAALATARESRVGSDGDIAVTVPVPDAWLDGSAEGALRYEAIRHLAEDQLGLTRVSWAGQLASVAVLAASQRGFAAPGRYLICDAGGSGVRVAACDVSGRTVRTLAVHDAPGGGWADFDAAIRTALNAGRDPGLDEWYRSAAEQDRRARMVFDRARTAADFRDARVYSVGGYELTAGQAADCFAPTADRIRAGAAAVLGAGAPSVAVLTGGLAWFPLTQQAVTDASGATPVVLGPEAAAAGALLLASGRAELAPHGLPAVAVPGHRITDGLLEEESLPLPWTDSFTSLDGGPLVLAEPALTLDIGGRQVRLAVPGLVSGPYRVGVRPAWSGTGVVVLRAPRIPPAAVAQAPDPQSGRDVFVIPLNLQEVPDE